MGFRSIEEMDKEGLIDLFRSMSNTFNDMERTLANSLVSDALASREGRYPLIPSGIEGFFNSVAQAALFIEHLYGVVRKVKGENPSLNLKDYRFLDVGAGVGGKVAIARSAIFNRRLTKAHWRADGIEVNPSYIEGAKVFYGDYGDYGDGPPAFSGDALTFEGYGRYALIYFYCPMERDELQRKLERVIYERAAEGTVFVQFMKRNFSREDQVGLRNLSPLIWMKITDDGMWEVIASQWKDFSGTEVPEQSRLKRQC
ncbi:MAG: hypothetical protein L0Y56_20800, partial [Nitrospira sp.]|nr:hypothetical protein [Nitrospira sp.]